VVVEVVFLVGGHFCSNGTGRVGYLRGYEAKLICKYFTKHTIEGGLSRKLVHTMF
jgi:hypothetical protein